MGKTQKEQKIKGIGGWLLFPIVGMFITIIIQAVDMIDTLMFYNLAEYQMFIITNAVLISLAGFSLYNIFKKNKNAKPLSIAFYVALTLLNLFVTPIALVGSLIWMFYFIKSERVKNTFVN